VTNNSEHALQFIKELINAYDQVLLHTEDEEKKLNDRIIALQNEVDDQSKLAEQAAEAEAAYQPRLDQLNKEVLELKTRLREASLLTDRSRTHGEKSDKLPDPVQFTGEGKAAETHQNFMV